MMRIHRSHATTRAPRKLAAFGSLAAATALVLTGCAGSPSGGDAKPAASDEPVTLEMSWWGDDARAALFGEVIDGFEKAHPNITVTETPVGAPEDLFNRLATDFGAGGDTAPDVFALGGAKPQEYGELGALLDLSTVSDQLDTSKYPDFSLTSAQVDGKLYGLPTGGNATAAFINADIFEEAGIDVPSDGWTWDDLIAAANEIGSKGLKNDDGQPIYGVDLRISDILGTYSGDMYTFEGQRAVDVDRIASWYQIEKQLLDGGGLPDPSVVTANWTLPPDQQPFTLGQAAVTFGYSNLMSAYAAAGDVKMMLPPEDDEVSGVALLPSAFWSINAASKHPAEAAQLIDWFLHEPSALELIKDTRGVPFNPDALAVVTPLLEGPSKVAAEYIDVVLDSGVVAAPQPAGGAIMNDLSQRMESDVLFGTKTPQEAAEQWVSELDAALQ